MSVSGNIGRCVSLDWVDHYRTQATGVTDTHRLFSIVDCIGNALYFSAREVCRVAAFAIRLASLLLSIPIAFIDKDLSIITDKCKLLGLTTVRLVTPFVQIVWTVLGSIAKLFAPECAQQFIAAYFFQVMHEIDNYLDQLELEIAGEPDDFAPGTDLNIQSIIQPFIPKRTCIERLITSGVSLDMIQECLKYQNTDLSVAYSGGNSILHIAVKESRVDVVQFLIESGANLSAQNNRGDTPLHLAVKCNNEPMVKFLVNKEEEYHSEVSNRLDTIPFVLTQIVGEYACRSIYTKNHEGKTPYELTSNPSIKQIFIDTGRHHYVNI